ncbi:Protocadherin Fat 4-like [Oopsacas minuta]|uniref:Protocadherin Fat 4-like n=1 Tax=Oopsacas minuta TaxID=111878 RepID=A0AAV7K3I4_9METZ|nr:Protocadherin Fat 4-like [Oopsacas minuta]
MIGLVEATDANNGIDGVTTYSVVEVDSRFRLDDNGGVIVFGFFDREVDVSSILITISAVDAPGGPIRYTAYTNVSITILDINDNFPIFTTNHQYKSLPENTPVTTSIAQFIATDIDIGLNSQIRYYIPPG